MKKGETWKYVSRVKDSVDLYEDTAVAGAYYARTLACYTSNHHSDSFTQVKRLYTLPRDIMA